MNNIKLRHKFVDYIISEFTKESDESEISPKGDIGNSPVKSMRVNFLYQVNCETKYTITLFSKCDLTGVGSFFGEKKIRKG